MNIKKVRDILKRDLGVSLHDLSLETGESETELHYIINDWVSAGKVQIIIEAAFCTGGCGGCPFASSCSIFSNDSPTKKKYRWIKKQDLSKLSF